MAREHTPFLVRGLAATTCRGARAALLCAASLLFTLGGCGSDSEPSAGETGVDYAERGNFGVGHRTLSVSDGTRSLQVELWYPAPTSAAGPEAAESYVEEAARAAFVDLLSAAPAECPTKSLLAERDAEPTGSDWPLIVYSHCVSCINLSGASLAIRLASHGFAVAAPNHAGPLPFATEDTKEPLTTDQLAVREADLRLVIDQLSSGEALPEALKGHIDASRIGALGHSFGSVTVGKLTQGDSRIRAVFGLAAPMENPLLAGVDMKQLKVPTALLIAQEDNSVQEIGNSLIRTNFDELTVPALEIEVYDAGHWSVSDLCGVDGFTPGCGVGTRHSQGHQGEGFQYLPVPQGIAIAQSYTTAFFRAELLGESAAADFMHQAHPEGGVGVRFK